MEKMIHKLQVIYHDIQLSQGEGRRLRGFFANERQEGSLLHNHGVEGKDIYRYPLVQYKVLQNHPVVVALEEGIDVLYPLVMERETLLLAGREYPCGHTEIEWKETEIGDTDQIFHYSFRTPWFGLNQNNFARYSRATDNEKQELLKHILIGNILSLSKGLGVKVERQLKLQTDLQPVSVSFKRETVLGFYGSFSVNYRIPNALGLGKSVSRGFGTVEREET